MMRRLFCALLCAVLILGFAPPGFAAAGFTDVRDKYWAIPYIDLARETGLIEGYKMADGSAEFRPENYVTKQECLVMLFNTLKLAGLVSEEDFTSEFDSFYSDFEPPKSGAPEGIPAWARPYISHALRNGVCEESDFSISVDNTGRSGGYSYASRELIALWTCRVTGYETSCFFEPVYDDWQNIGKEYLPAVDALYRHGIMQGNKGMFYPQNGVKRSEMAAICMRLLGVRADEDRGVVTSRGIISNDGTVKAGAVLYDSEKYLKSLSQKDRGLELFCTITGADRISQTLTAVCDGSEKTFFYTEDLRIDADGEVLSAEGLSDLAGEEVLLGSMRYAPETLMIQRSPVVRSGEIVRVSDMGLYKLVTLELEDGTQEAFFITDASAVKGSVKKNKNVSFIADGLLILEMR